MNETFFFGLGYGGWGVGPVGWANPGGLRLGFPPSYFFFLFSNSIPISCLNLLI
jgi:hypothetical protein